ncbi:hypothetical protein PHYSODRAFT_328401 [Phytophthora sojae]|uniref:Peptidase A2 domain-containing protein n=1 Tax=Phytophthora sojae (strain P6497) TaxID=1094619 RepID=G4Z5Z1_PHYSP|nr:hypothetical protein PHYSODRAFT_328401 [Phytophthora sojae]EGZ20270.1 hypothetical protein PHYSODRAFT_328401 [Phytophthora sojae]|eukprot:XP_009522987.1 hypothetical protein PHYSODRAFT_328401 [Phytophthora sojae]
MVRVPGSSGGSGFHRESQEEVRVKKEQGDQASSESGSTTTLLNETRSTDRQSARRISVGGTEVDPDMDPEEKPQPPPQVPSGTPVDRDEMDPIMQKFGVKQIGALQEHLTLPVAVKRPRTLPEMERLMQLLRDAGLVAGAFDASVMYEIDPIQLRATTKMLFNRLKVLVGEIQPKPDPAIPDPRSLQEGSTGCRTSSPYVSAAELGSDTSSEPRRMSLGPSGASMLRARAQIQREASPQSRSQPRPKKQSAPLVDPTATASGSDISTSRLESFFQAAMNRFLKEQGALTPAMTPGAVQNHGSQDVEMESTGSSDPDPHWEFDPDDIDFPAPARATVATTATGSTGSALIQRVRISAVSDLKEFSDKDQDEDRARAWVSKVKSAFLRDQAPDEEKCLTFADLLSGSARNWYRQLPRSTRNKWPDLLRSFQTQYCGLGISVARQYYHARKRSDESPLNYLYRLNVAGLRDRLKIKDGGSKKRREHVDHSIETLGDQDLADRLTLLRLPDADELEEVLRALDRARNRQKKSAYGSSKYRQKAPATPAPAAPAKHVRAIQIEPDSGSESESSDGSDSECDEYRRIYLSASYDHAKPTGSSKIQPPAIRDPRSTLTDPSEAAKCGKKGHPGDHCLFVCRGCGDLHDVGRCPMEEFYNQIQSSYLLPGESRGYWKQHSPGKWFRQAKIHDKINNDKAILLLDTGAELSIVDTAFARKVGCYIDRSQSQECVGIRDNVYTTEGRARIKITLGGYLVYFFDIWVGDLSGQETILGMDYMVPAGIRLDLADGTLCLPDEVRIQLSGRRSLCSDKAQSVKLDRYLQLGIGESAELPMRLRGSEHDKLWGPDKVQYLQITNIGEKELVLRQNHQVGIWLAGDRVPRIEGYVSVGSRRYMEWRNLALQATTNAGSAEAGPPETPEGPMVERPEYPTPHAILWRQDPAQVRQEEPRSKSAGGGRGKSLPDPPGQAIDENIAGAAEVLQLQASIKARTRDQRPEETSGQVPGGDPQAEDSPDQDPSDEESLGVEVQIQSPSPQVRSTDLGCGRDEPTIGPPSRPYPTVTQDNGSIRQEQPHTATAWMGEAQDPVSVIWSKPDPGGVPAERQPDPDPTADRSVDDALRPADGSTSQDPTDDTQGRKGALSPDDVRRSVDPVVTSGGNHGETGGGSADSTDGDMGQAMDPVELQVSDGEMGRGADPDGETAQESGPTPDPTVDADPTTTIDPSRGDADADEQVCYHVSGDLHAEDVEAEMAVLPEVTANTDEVTIEDIQVGDSEVNTAEEIDLLRRRIWRRRHLLIGKGNALPPAARGVVCDIDVGDAKPIAQRVRKVAPQYHEKLSDLIKGLLGAKIIKD